MFIGSVFVGQNLTIMSQKLNRFVTLKRDLCGEKL